jgi:hypothetical protein
MITIGEQTGARSQAADTEVSSFLAGIAIAAISFGFVAAGIAWPQAASSLLRLLLVTAAILFVAARAWHALAWVHHKPDRQSPFNGLVSTHTPPVAPHALRRLSAQLHAAANAEQTRATPIPWTTRRMLIDEASRRLAERHGLDLGDPNHHAHIRSLVSEPTRLLILTDDATTPDSLSMRHLEPILDDLENL